MITPNDRRLKVLKEDTVTTDGTEQTLLEKVGLASVSGYVDVSNLQAGDTIKISVYIKVKSTGSYLPYAYQSVTGVQDPSILYLVYKNCKNGLKITLKTTAGVSRSFDYQFFKEA